MNPNWSSSITTLRGLPDTLSDLRSALMFLDNPNVKVLGFTVVIGNGWRNEEVAHLLRLEEIASRCDVPVIPGAVTPLVNTLQTTREWERHYSHRYMGAWDTKDQRPWETKYSPHERDFVPQIRRRLAQASAGAGICRRISDQTGAHLPTSNLYFRWWSAY